MDLAREVGGQIQSPSYVAVDGASRHLETALAMGFAADEQSVWPSGYVAGEVEHHDQWRWDQPFVRYAELTSDQGSRIAAIASEHLQAWLRIVERLDDGASALVISSGGSIEPALTAALPDADHGSWGGALHQMEGATLSYCGHRFVDLTLRRLDTPLL